MVQDTVGYCFFGRFTIKWSWCRILFFLLAVLLLNGRGVGLCAGWWKKQSLRQTLSAFHLKCVKTSSHHVITQTRGKQVVGENAQSYSFKMSLISHGACSPMHGISECPASCLPGRPQTSLPSPVYCFSIQPQLSKPLTSNL